MTWIIYENDPYEKKSSSAHSPGWDSAHTNSDFPFHYTYIDKYEMGLLF